MVGLYLALIFCHTAAWTIWEKVCVFWEERSRRCRTEKCQSALKKRPTEHEKQIEANHESWDRQILMEFAVTCDVICYCIADFLILSSRFLVLPLGSVTLPYIILQLFSTPPAENTSHYNRGCLFVWTQHKSPHVSSSLWMTLKVRQTPLRSTLDEQQWTHGGREGGSLSPRGPVVL